MYFGIYQALSTANEDVFRQYRPDFFDLIIIDECHRGSSRNDSNWRAVLDYFAPAVQFGMTATPLREESRDSYEYFGNPVYTYSLRQGIEDGFLAPYRVHRVITTVDAAGWRPSKDELDRFGRPVPDDEYQTKDYIIDFTGTATRHFADPDFDGDPARIKEVTIDDAGETIESVIETPPGVEEPPADYTVDTTEADAGQGEIITEPPEEPRKFYVDGGDVEVIGHLVYDLDTDGKKLQVVKYTEYSGRTVRTLYPARLPGFAGLVEKVYETLATAPNAVQQAAIKAEQFDTAIGLLEADIVGGRETVRRTLAGILTPDLSAPNATAHMMPC